MEELNLNRFPLWRDVRDAQHSTGGGEHMPLAPAEDPVKVGKIQGRSCQHSAGTAVHGGRPAGAAKRPGTCAEPGTVAVRVLNGHGKIRYYEMHRAWPLNKMNSTLDGWTPASTKHCTEKCEVFCGEEKKIVEKEIWSDLVYDFVWKQNHKF